MAIERIAKEHVGWGRRTPRLREALAVVSQFAQRDAIATACNGVVTVSDEAYFYAGLAFGVTREAGVALAWLPRPGRERRLARRR